MCLQSNLLSTLPILQNQLLFQKKKEGQERLAVSKDWGPSPPDTASVPGKSHSVFWCPGAPHREGCRELAITDPAVLKQAALGSTHCCASESASSNTGSPIFFSLMIHFVFPQRLSQRSAIYNWLWTCLPAPGKERAGSEKISRAQMMGAPLSHIPSSMGALLISGFSLPRYCICHFQTLQRYNTEKLSTYFLLNSLQNSCSESLNPLLFWGPGLDSSLTNQLSDLIEVI